MSSDPNCVFCKIVGGQIPSIKLYEDTDTLSFMDINPLNPGHCLAIPKVHFPDVFSIDAVTIAKTATTARRIARAVQAALSPPGLNLVQSNGPAAAQSVLHFHFHILPRRDSDVAALNWAPKPGKMDEIKAVAEKIRAKLEP
mgnify:CR=1 FL=1